MIRKSLTLVFSLAVLGVSGSAWAVAMAPKNAVGQTDFHLKEFEKEVALQRGGEKMVWRNRREALERVKQLKTDYPEDPEVEKLNQRARVALMKSLGKWTEVDPNWTIYKRNEENLRKIIYADGKKQWDKLIEEHKADLLPKLFPAPDHTEVSIESLQGKYVILEDVRYPSRQFYGATSEYVWSGKPSEGYYFVNLSTRKWLGPYEAVKRYRRNVNSALKDVTNWTVLGKIVDIAAEIPQAGEEKTGTFQSGWVVEPVALMVPDHVVSYHDAEAPASGRFYGEDKVDSIKDGWYTHKSVPSDVTPEKLMEIFMTAIKEKNYKLYLDCINPERRGGEYGSEMIRYHWDLHQERFANEYVHATFDKAKISIVKGFDQTDELNEFFLTDNQKEFLEKAKGRKTEHAIVESRALNDKGQQIGSPHPHTLIRKGGGRWYVEDYMLRF